MFVIFGKFLNSHWMLYGSYDILKVIMYQRFNVYRVLIILENLKKCFCDNILNSS